MRLKSIAVTSSNLQSEKMILWYFFLILFTLLSLLATPVLAQEEEEEEEPAAGERPALSASVLSPDFKFDGLIDITAWQAATDSIEDLVTIEPEEGGEPQSQTVVKVFASSTDIIVAVRCYEDPNAIVSFSKARDSELEGEDYIMLVFDTFQDGRSGYVFAVNPSGARFDALVIEKGEDVNSDWDAIWEAKTSRDEEGWYAEIRIPIKSIGYKKGLTSWGFNVQRNVQHLQEVSRWSAISRDFEVYQTSRAGLLEDLPEFDFGLGLSVRPAVVGRARKDTGSDTEYEFEPSLDLTQRLGPNLLASLTVNTDFAETEVDVRKINLTRFPLFFPEKRTFFLQGADIFEFGVALDEDTFIPFYSRRIGLVGQGEDNLKEVPINAGGKINGRIGNTNIAALVVNTREVDSLDLGDVDEDIKIHVPQTTMGSVRINQNILEESSIGVLANFGDQLGRKESWTAGADFVFRTSNFLNEKNLQISAWFLRNNREDLKGGAEEDSVETETKEPDKNAYGFRAEYPNDLLDLSFSTIRLGDGFDPSLGFVPRNDYHLWDATAEFRPRPAWEWLRVMTYEASFKLYNERDNSDWVSYEGTIKPVDWLLESGDSFNGGITLEGDRPPEVFELASNVDLPPGSYEWTRYFLEARSAEKRKISGNILWEFGNYYNGDLSTIEASLALKPSAFLTLELTAERNEGKVQALPDDFDIEEEDELAFVEKKFTEELFGARLLLNFSSDLQFSSLTQYDTESKELGSNNRLRWTFHPHGDIFIVYNHNLVRRKEENRWQFVSNELPIKVQYTWRF